MSLVHTKTIANVNVETTSDFYQIILTYLSHAIPPPYHRGRRGGYGNCFLAAITSRVHSGGIPHYLLPLTFINLWNLAYMPCYGQKIELTHSHTPLVPQA